MEFLAVIHPYILSYGRLEGFLRTMSAYIVGLKVPDYSTTWWRANKMKVELDPDVGTDEEVTVAADSSGIKLANRRDWLNGKWGVGEEYLKIDVAVGATANKSGLGVLHF